MKVEAKYWKKLDDDSVRCLLCPHVCLIPPGKGGGCWVRVNENGKLYSYIYGRVSSSAWDPIEKKPLYHFYPGSVIYSVGTIGCNFHCPQCQNWEISQLPGHYGLERALSYTAYLPPEEAARRALSRGSIGIAYTYSEPIIWFEWVYDTAKLVKEAGGVNVLVTNGFINPEPFKELLPLIDAANIDLKGIKQEHYDFYGGRLEPVLRTIKLAAGKLRILELTNLIVTGVNDSTEDIKQLVDWVYNELGPDVPLHFSRYFPAYKYDAPPTPIEKLKFAYEYASEKLNYVYLGNVLDVASNTTRCPKCGAELIVRQGYFTRVKGLAGKKCSNCGYEINIVVEEDK